MSQNHLYRFASLMAIGFGPLLLIYAFFALSYTSLFFGLQDTGGFATLSILAMAGAPLILAAAAVWLTRSPGSLWSRVLLVWAGSSLMIGLVLFLTMSIFGGASMAVADGVAAEKRAMLAVFDTLRSLLDLQIVLVPWSLACGWLGYNMEGRFSGD
jgi:hypothetical protein